LVGGPNLAAPLALPGLPEKIEWATMEREHKFSLPAADARAGPQLAVMRLKWETRDAQPNRLTATIDCRVSGLVEEYRFEVPIRGVVPLMVSNPNLNVGDLGYNDVRETGFYCFSATRPGLDLQLEAVNHDPCIDVPPPRAL